MVLADGRFKNKAKMKKSLDITKLNKYQKAVYKAIENFNKPPITIDNIKIEISVNDRSLQFSVDAETSDEFNVQLIVYEDEYLLSADAWHEHYVLRDNPEEIAESILMKLITMFDGRIKLRVTYAGQSPYKWEVIHNWDEGYWESLSVTGSLLFNYFGKHSTVEKINHKLEFEGYFDQPD